MATRRTAEEETADQPPLEGEEPKKSSKTEGKPTEEEMDPNIPQVVRERERMRKVYEERGRRS